jgi:hypothetical protein
MGGEAVRGITVAEDTTSSNALVPSGEGRRYSVGDAVRVRTGVIDPDFPDIPVSGWAGVIAECEDSDPPLYLVRWTAETLSRVTPVYRVRCDREGLDPTQTSLLGEDLEPDTGGPLTIAAPTRLRPPPLDRDDPQDRVRGIFKLTSDDPLPPVDAASLRRFHEHFRKKLKVPAAAICSGAPLAQEVARVLRLVPFEETKAEQGLLVEVEQGDKIATGPLYDISLLSLNAVAKDIEAYSDWFFEEEDEEDEDDDEEFANHPIVFVGEGRQAVRRDREPEEEEMSEAEAFQEFKASAPFIGRIALACILVGALVGALLWVHEWAMVMAEGGAILLGCVGGFIGTRTRFVVPEGRSGVFIGVGIAVVFALMGASIGGAVGVLLLAYLGAIPGALAGTLFGMVLTACGVRNHSTFFLAILGSYIGGVVYVFTFDAGEALAGALRGAAGGLGAFVVCLLGGTWVMSHIRVRRE